MLVATTLSKRRQRTFLSVQKVLWDGVGSMSENILVHQIINIVCLYLYDSTQELERYGLKIPESKWIWEYNY